MATDDQTSIQALERKYPSLPMQPGKVGWRELEYILHGTCTAILSRDVTGPIIDPALGPARTEADFLAYVQGVVASSPSGTAVALCRARSLPA